MCLYHDPSSVWQEVTRAELEADLARDAEDEGSEAGAEPDGPEPPTPADD